MSILEEADMKNKLDMEDNKGEAAATLFEDCQSDQLTRQLIWWKTILAKMLEGKLVV